MLKFNFGLAQLFNIDVQIATAALKNTTTDQNLKLHLTLKPPRDLQELESKTNNFIRAEEACVREWRRGRPRGKKKEDGRGAEKLQAEERPANWNPIPVFERLGNAPLKVPLSHVLFAIRDQGLLTPPKKLSTDPRKRSSGRFSEFHRDHGHETDHCFHLRLQLEKLAEEVATARGTIGPPKEKSLPARRQPPSSRPLLLEKSTSSREGLQQGGTTAGRRAYAEQVYSLKISSKKAWTDPLQESQVISFSTENYNGLQVPHDDALVIRLIIANFDVGKILVDIGSSVNVLHLETFEEMKLGKGRLGPAEYSIYGFSGASVRVSGRIDLLVTFRTHPLQKIGMTTFLVVDIPFTYSAIIGRPVQRDLRAVVSTPPQLIAVDTPF
ncbi:uncharacterized protein LOC143869792 [Tasmannia lanceolata]|uniref:uncharacterized protein LOC143869792 n=1 Tax=Tasmannia lanceolata TaxID=3420 RepID=UPI004062A65D